MLESENKTENTFAQRLKAARKKIHRTGKDIADMTGMNYQTYMSYETKGSLPSSENLIKLSNVLGVSTDYLLKGKNFTPSPKIFSKADIDNMSDETFLLMLNNGNLAIESTPIATKTVLKRIEQLKNKKTENDINPLIDKIIDLLANNENVNFRGYPITSDNAKRAITQALYTVKVMARYPSNENLAADFMYNQSRQNADYFRNLQTQEQKPANKKDKPSQ